MQPNAETNDQAAAPSPSERTPRKKTTLRGLVDGLLEHIRDLSNRVDDITPEDLEYEHQRFNTIAELTWAAITDEKKRHQG